MMTTCDICQMELDNIDDVIYLGKSVLCFEDATMLVEALKERKAQSETDNR